MILIVETTGFDVFDPAINAFSIVTDLVDGPWMVERATLEVPIGRESPLAAHVDLRSGTIPVVANLDFLHLGKPEWTIAIKSDAGSLVLSNGGQSIAFDGQVDHGENREYARLYARFAGLIATAQSDVDDIPLALVLDALERGKRIDAPAFEW